MSLCARTTLFSDADGKRGVRFFVNNDYQSHEESQQMRINVSVITDMIGQS